MSIQYGLLLEMINRRTGGKFVGMDDGTHETREELFEEIKGFINDNGYDKYYGYNPISAFEIDTVNGLTTQIYDRASLQELAIRLHRG